MNAKMFVLTILLSLMVYQPTQAFLGLDTLKEKISQAEIKAKDFMLIALSTYVVGEVVFRRVHKLLHMSDPIKTDRVGYIRSLAFQEMKDLGVITQDILQQVVEEVVKQIKEYVDNNNHNNKKTIRKVVNEVLQKKMKAMKPMNEEKVRAVSESVQ